MEIGLGLGNSPESAGVVMEFPIFDGADLSSPPTVPARLRRRLTESKVSTSSVEEIEAKLHNADLRRQKFYENLSSKARPKHKSPQAADEHNLAQRLEAKLLAAEQNRMQILKVNSQRRATLSEKTSQSLKRAIALQKTYNQKHEETEKKKTQNRFLQIANPVSQQQEIESRKSSEDRLQRAKRQKAEYLMQNNKTQKQADHLSRNLKRCWRKFLKQRTTLNLTKSYHTLNINSSQLKSMPFEHFAFLIESSSTLQTTKALLDRLETRYRVLLNVTSQTNLNDINHLLTRVVSPNHKYTKTVITLSRYQPRVVLSGYMILAHPDAVFSGQGVRETALTNSAKKFIQEFELLIDIILNGPKNGAGEESNHERARFCTFRSQVVAFDESWCSYLNSFVVWKVKDVESLEEDLIRAAFQLEISMMKKCKRAPEVDDSGLTDDVKAFQKQMQVTEHQKLLMEKIMHLSGEAGIARLQKALSHTRKSKDKSTPADLALTVSSNEKNNNSSVASSSDSVNLSGETVGMEKVLIVNAFLHGQSYLITDRLRTTDENKKVGEIMEKAFWDGITESIKEEKYDHVVVLMKEVRDELSEMSPKIMKQEIFEIIDLDILSQLLSSGRLDIEYLGKIMEFALISLQKLSAVAHENQLKESHQKFISELAQLCQAGDGSTRSHAIALIKGLRFVLEQIQALKQEISKARIKILEAIVNGPSGLEYLEKAFRKQYGPPSDALIRLPRTMEWLSSVVPIKDESWDEHKMALLQLQQASSSSLFLPSTALRTGGSFSTKLQTSTAMSFTDNGFTDCKGEKGDLLVRLGLLKLVNTVNGVTQEELPETLKLNYLRLRSVQNQLQKITVIATSILVLRQTLIMEKIISNPEEIESTILTCSADLSNVLDTVTDAGLEELVEILGKTIERFDTSNNLTKSESTRLVIARMLTKSLQAGDPVFVRVSRAVYLATRGVVLGGCGGGGGRELAVVALRRVSAAVLTDKVVEAAVVLGVMARVSENVHGLWYAQLIEDM